jgi:hypothetical protein
MTYYNESSEDEENDESNDDESSDDDEYEDSIMYEPDEQSPTKYNIVLCDIYNDKLHGVNRDLLHNQYMVIAIFKYLDVAYLNRMAGYYNRAYVDKVNLITPHSCIRNYRNIISSHNYVKPEIAHCFLLAGGEQVCILKTIWIRLIQRAWKRVYRERFGAIRMRSNPRSLIHRQLTRGWNNRLTSLRGMLLHSRAAS